MDFNRRKRRTSSVPPESDTLNKNKRKVQFRHSSTFSNIEASDRKANNDLIQNVMQDPEKRALLLQLLAQEKETIIENKKYLQFNGNLDCTPKKIRNKPRFESPSALWKRRAMEKQQASENGSVSSDQLPPIHASPTVPFEKLLEGVVGFVELKCKGEDKSLGAKKLMLTMGAEVRDTFTKDVTHVVFKDGSFNTYYKAKLLKIHLVSVLWLDAIKTTGIRVPEQKFPAFGFSSGNHDLSKICLDFQNDYEEMIQDEFKKTLALSTEILSQSFNDHFVTKRKKNIDTSSSSEDDFTNSDPNNLNCIPHSNKKLSTQNWLQNITNSSHSDQLDDSSNSLSEVESDCGMVDGCSAKKSKELQRLNESVSNSIFEIDSLIETTRYVKDTFNNSGFRNLLQKKYMDEKEQKSYSRGTNSTSTSDSKSLLTGRNLRRSSRISLSNELKNSNATENLSSLRLSTTDVEQNRKSKSNNLENSNKQRNSKVKSDIRISNTSSIMSSLRISSSTSNSKNENSKNKKCMELESENTKELKKNSASKSNSNLNSDKNLIAEKINSSDETETRLNNSENNKNQLVLGTESSSNPSFPKTIDKTKNKRRKLFNPDEFLLEEGYAEDEYLQKKRKALGKNIEVKQPIVLLNSTVLMENVKSRINISSQQETKKQTENNLSKAKTKRNEDQENNSPHKSNLKKNDLPSSQNETDSPTKQRNHTKEKQIKDLAVRRSVRIRTKKLTQKRPMATSDSQRRSSYDFVPKGKALSQNKVRKSKMSIVCTRLHRPDVKTFMQIVKKLGTFYTEDEVSEKTTHLVAGESRRTVNMLRALARGCWILKIEWLYKSLEAGRWIEEEDYELIEFSPAVQQCRKQRQAFGSLYSMDIFENVGPVFVSNASVPRRSDLEELIILCKGTITRTISAASVVVGESVNSKQPSCISENWVLDSIMYNKKKPFKNYFLKLNKRVSKEF